MSAERIWPDLQSSHPDFVIVRRWWQACLAHKTKPIWIVRYKATQDRAKHFQVYQAIEGCGDQHPCKGGVNNRRISPVRGFKTLAQAIEAA